VVSTSNGTFTGPGTITYTYQWQLCPSSSQASSCTSIANATNQEFIPTHDEVTSFLRVVVTGHDSGGAAADEPSGITPAVESEAPGIGLPGAGGGNTPPVVSVSSSTSNDGIPRTGDTLSATPATFNAPSADSTVYEWTRCNSGGTSCQPIAGAAATNTPPSYTVATADIGSTIRMRARGSNANGTSELYSAPTPVVEPAPGSSASPSPSPSAGGGSPRPTPPDHTPPQTRFTLKPGALVLSRTATAYVRFAFTANEPARFQCKLDRGPFLSCRSPAKITVRASRAGVRHTFKVRAIDRAGNVDPTPSSFTFVAKHPASSSSPRPARPVARTG
jgi:hypothetical protein